MAVILTKKAETTTGIELSDVYINITEIYINKTNSTIQIAAQAFANKKARTDNKEPIKINNIGLIESSISSELDINTDKVNVIAYKILKARLKDLNFNSKDDI